MLKRRRDMSKRRPKTKERAALRDIAAPSSADYGRLVSEISGLLEQARRFSARSVNAILTATYWQIGRRLVEHEQNGSTRAEYGHALLHRLAGDLTRRYGRGFSRQGLQKMRAFYIGWQICPTVSGKFEARVICPTPSGKRDGVLAEVSVIAQTPPGRFGVTPAAFPLSWSQYVRLMAVSNPVARAFYESEAIRGGWSVRQLDRQIATQFYERAITSKDRAALLARSQVPREGDLPSADDEVRDPYLLEFLNLKDEYSESELEEALIRHLEWFLLELGAGFTFAARQKRIRIGDTWYRIDLLLYHRLLRCLVIIDLKTGAFTHADAGQMNLYLNYAREHLMMPGETDPVGIILCSDKDDAVVKYATGGINARVFTSKYLTNLPDPEALREEILKTQKALQLRRRERKTR